MGRFFIFLGIVLIFVAVGLMIAIFSVADVEFIEDIFIDMYCEEGATSISHARGLTLSGSQNYSDIWYCVDSDGEEREITGNIALTAIVAFIAPFLLGMLMIFYGAWTIQRNFTKRVMTSFTGEAGDMEIYSMRGASNFNLSNANLSPENRAQVEQVLQSVSRAFGAPASSNTLTDRLQQLEDARKQGLISSTEYERTRQAILDSMDDNL